MLSHQAENDDDYKQLKLQGTKQARPTLHTYPHRNAHTHTHARTHTGHISGILYSANDEHSQEGGVGGGSESLIRFGLHFMDKK